MLLWPIGFAANGMSIVNGEDRLISFDRDIRPVLAAKCIQCHGPDDAKNDFRVDQSEALLDYIEPGTAADSTLWADYLVTTDDDTRMPPVDEAPLTGSELAAIKVWIEEGAEWESPADAAAIESEVKPVEPASLMSKSWTFQGLFHPVSVHLPVALLSISCFFLVLSYKFPNASFQAVAFHSLWVGAIGAIGACVTGWSYAQHEGYGNFSFDVIGSLVDRHRWSGIAVAVVSLVLLPLAVKVHLRQQQQLRKFWLIGSILVAVMVGGTGNWGGELIQGSNHYFNEFKQLFLADGVEGKAADVQENAVEE
ncbi:MAG: c-type cytochrome domain-containing protein [Fuerstiella sp.]